MVLSSERQRERHPHPVVLLLPDDRHRVDLRREAVRRLRRADDRLQAQPLLDRHLGLHRTHRDGGKGKLGSVLFEHNRDKHFRLF